MINAQKSLSLAELREKGGMQVFKVGPKQILLLEIEDKLFALDNRCPHEGYPLSQGSTDKKSCVLTCNWHNWKFDLLSGKCLLGADNVRTYPVEISGDQVTVDISEKSPQALMEETLTGLKEAFEKRQYGRFARELSRMHFQNLDPLQAIRCSILWSYERLEFGTTHAYAALADWLTLYQTSEALEDKIIALTEAIDHVSFDSLRHSQYKYAPAVEIVFQSSALEEAVENENLVLSEGLINGAFDQGLRFKDLEEVFSRIALAHYNDFGHSLIYVQKTKEITNHFDDIELERALSLALVRSLSYATREDLLPEFKNYQGTLNSLNGEVKEFEKKDLLDCTTNELYEWLRVNIKERESQYLYSRLFVECAKSMLYFDESFACATQNSVNQNVGWLDFTHALTFASAVRVQCEKFPSLWPQGLLQIASFLGRNRPYRAQNEEMLAKWRAPEESTFTAKLKEMILDHGLGLPIFSAHVLKTSLAVLEEGKLLDPEARAWAYAALNRFVHSPIKQKHARRLTHQALNLVKKDFN